jgi:hypothetical protein
MEPIKLTNDLRVSDYDAQQYVIERRTVVENSKEPENNGKIVWSPIAYCGSVKSLPRIALQRVSDEYARDARDAAEIEFDAMGLGAVLAALPPKGRD